MKSKISVLKNGMTVLITAISSSAFAANTPSECPSLTGTYKCDTSVSADFQEGLAAKIIQLRSGKSVKFFLGSDYETIADGVERPSPFEGDNGKLVASCENRVLKVISTIPEGEGTITHTQTFKTVAQGNIEITAVFSYEKIDVTPPGPVSTVCRKVSTQ